jgi:cell division septal protein FtsQ
MTSRFRTSRRSTREPAIWRTPAGGAAVELERTPVQHSTRGRTFISARVFSGLIILSLCAVLVLFFASDVFYISSFSVGGLRYMTPNEIFALTNVTNMHVFWIDPAEVREGLLRSPTIANATVHVGWPPNMLTLIIEEREPALVWEQSGTASWIDLQGRVMQQREDRSDLVRIQVDPLIEGNVGASIDPQIVMGTIQLHTLVPEVTVLRYHPDKGLGYNDQRGWEVWLGVGSDTQLKMLIYDAIVDHAESRGIVLSEVNLVNPHAPVYSVLSER